MPIRRSNLCDNLSRNWYDQLKDHCDKEAGIQVSITLYLNQSWDVVEILLPIDSQFVTLQVHSYEIMLDGTLSTDNGDWHCVCVCVCECVCACEVRLTNGSRFSEYCIVYIHVAKFPWSKVYIVILETSWLHTVWLPQYQIALQDIQDNSLSTQNAIP